MPTSPTRAASIRRLMLAGLAGVLLFPAVSGAAPRTYEVTKRSDPSPGNCSARDCSLREAIIAANGHAGRDRVRLEGGRVYQLRRVGADEDEGLTGDFDVVGALTIRAGGGGRATVDGNDLDRVFHIPLAGDGTVAFQRIVVRDGAETTGGTGGIESSAPLVLSNSAVRSNRGEDAGGLETSGAGAVIRKSVIARNTVTDSGGAVGASIDGPARIVSSSIRGNRSPGASQGGLALFGPATVARTTIAGNAAEATGGVTFFGEGSVLRRSTVRDNAIFTGAGSPVAGVNAGCTCASLRIVRSRIVGNDSNGSGAGGVWAFDLVIENSLLAGNDGNPGGAVGIAPIAGSALITGSVLRRNQANAGAGIAVFNQGSAIVRRSTIARNVVTNEGGGIVTGDETAVTVLGSTLNGNRASLSGGAIGARNSAITLVNSTVAGNAAAFGGGISNNNDGSVALNAVTLADNHAFDEGGGIVNFLGLVTFDNSLLARNSVGAGGTGPNCSGTFISGDSNLLTSTSGCVGFTGPGDLVRPRPRIGKLKDNGGPTRTIALRRRSPAVGNAGDDTPARDQRGRGRDSRPDIGAYER